MSKDHFAGKASVYDQNQIRQDNVGQIAEGIRQRISLSESMHLMDFGAGTGLLLQRLAPHVGRITAVDVSPAMLEQLEAKRGEIACDVVMRQADLTCEYLDARFDGVISSMTLHHIQDVPALLKRLHGMVKAGGVVALADLESEDGSFHDEDTGVFHHGFDPEAVKNWLADAGFHSVESQRVSVIEKPKGSYPVFLVTAIA